MHSILFRRDGGGYSGTVASDPVDVDRHAKITPYRNGPYLVRGPFTLVDQDGNNIEVERRIVALCRCGRSQARPFCDGTHKLVGFESESGRSASP